MKISIARRLGPTEIEHSYINEDHVSLSCQVSFLINHHINGNLIGLGNLDFLSQGDCEDCREEVDSRISSTIEDWLVDSKDADYHFFNSEEQWFMLVQGRMANADFIIDAYKTQLHNIK